ncbi:MAG: hypothetical protein ACO1OG_00805 [Devosia sp.]
MTAVERRPHNVSSSLPEALSWRLGTFRPSDRDEFQRAFQTIEGRKAAYDAVVIYVTKWEEADWVEEYSLERIGRWLSKSAPTAFVSDVAQWSRGRRTKARLAFKRGLTR